MKNHDHEIGPIGEAPRFSPAQDIQLYLDEIAKQKPEIAHVLARLSTESQYREWLVTRMVVVNNTLVGSQNVSRETNDLLREQNDILRNMGGRLEKVEIQSSASAAIITDWTIKFKSPLTILGMLMGVVSTAAIGALISRIFK